jgi:hypothetical protein
LAATACAGAAALLMRRGSAITAALAILAVPLIASRITPRAEMFTVVLFAATLSLSQALASTFKVGVAVSGAQNVFSIPLEISYDPNTLQVVDVSNGGFLGQDGKAVALVYRTDTSKGTLQIAGTRPPNSGGVSGSGTVFVITLMAKSAGESVMDISGASLVDSSMQAASAVGGDMLIKITSKEPPAEEKNGAAPPIAQSDQAKPQRLAIPVQPSGQPE